MFSSFQPNTVSSCNFYNISASLFYQIHFFLPFLESDGKSWEGCDVIHRPMWAIPRRCISRLRAVRSCWWKHNRYWRPALVGSNNVCSPNSLGNASACTGYMPQQYLKFPCEYFLICVRAAESIRVLLCSPVLSPKVQGLYSPPVHLFERRAERLGERKTDR